MPRTRRVIVQGRMYEVVTRAREGLPLPPTTTTNTLVTGILARTQRDDKVTLCNYVHVNNHFHKNIVSKDPEKFVRFYGEFNKKITDSLRKMLGRKTLRLWEDRASVMLIAELGDCINRLVYLFCNPAKADLADSIDTYIGLSSWQAFKTCSPSVDAEVRIDASWVPASELPRLPQSRILKDRDDKNFSEKLRFSKKRINHTLVLKPLAWLRHYGITDPAEIESIRQTVISRVYAEEAEIRKARIRERRRAVSPGALRHQAYLKSHTPKKKDRKIFVICANGDLRKELIRIFKKIFDKCSDAYQMAKLGLNAEWPPGTFIPWLPPRNSFALS